MKNIVIYRVRRPFKYNGELLKKDSIFFGGGKFDDQLKEGPLLYRTEMTESEFLLLQAEKPSKASAKKPTRRKRNDR